MAVLLLGPLVVASLGIVETDKEPMVLLPAGGFVMGGGDRDDEKPVRKVYVDEFWIDQYEVTNRLYEAFVRKTGHRLPEYWQGRVKKFTAPMQPVVGVYWDEAQAYCEWAGRRLPTEAEWEKAARGTDRRVYPWGNEWDPQRANVADRVGKPAPVGSYENGRSPYGVYDMAGNVWEWVWDWYAQDTYRVGPTSNPRGPLAGRLKVVRGGSYTATAAEAKTTARFREHPESVFPFLGFRCAKDGSKRKRPEAGA